MPGVFLSCTQIDTEEKLTPKKSVLSDLPKPPSSGTHPSFLMKMGVFSKNWGKALFLSLCVLFVVMGVLWGQGALKSKNKQLYISQVHPDFIGHDKDLHEIKHRLFTQDFKKKSALLAINGEGGVGKTEIAIAFAHRYARDFSLVHWMDGSNPEALERSYLALAHALQLRVGSTEGVVAKTHYALEKSGDRKPWLLIFDDMREMPTNLPKEGGCILLTCRDKGLCEPSLTFEVQKSEEAAIQLMEKITGEKKSEKMVQLIQDLGAIPLLVNSVSHYIAETPGFSVDKYFDIFSLIKDSDKSPYFSKDLREYYPRSLATTYQITLDLLYDKEPLAVEFLKHAVYLHSNRIPDSFVEEWLKVKMGNVPEIPLLKGDILRELTNHGLVRYDAIGFTSIHRPLQDILIQQQLEAPPLAETLEAFLSLKEVEGYNPTFEETVEPFQRVLPHCTTLLTHLRRESLLGVRLALITARYYLDTQHHLLEAENYLMRCKHWVEEWEHPLKGRVEFLMGVLNYKKASKYKDVEFYEKALKCFEKAYLCFSTYQDSATYKNLEQNPLKCTQEYQKAIALQYQAQTLKELSCFAEAEQVFSQALNAFKCLTEGGDHFDIARILREQGSILAKQGNFKGALVKVEEAIAMQKRVYKERFFSQPTVGATYRVLGDLLFSSQSYLESDQAYQKAITANLAAYKTENHPYIAHLYRRRGEVFTKLGQLKIAQEMEKRREAILSELSHSVTE